MKVAVVGGTGALGSQLVSRLLSGGDEVLVLSRNAGDSLPAGAEHRRVDLTDGSGLAPALAGVEVVLDASNSNPRNAAPVLVEGTQRLLRAEAEAGVRHHVAVSIVGCDRVPTSYYEVKVRQEEAIAAAEVPWSLVRATQFHALIAWAFEKAGRLRLLPTGSARLQPVEVGVVAERLVGVARSGPAGRVGDVAGPQVETLSELARAWRRSGHAALPLRIPMVGRVGRPLREGALCNPDAASGGPSFAEWLAHE